MGRNTAHKPKKVWRGAELGDTVQAEPLDALPPGEPYPLPSHAASIWATGKGLMLGLPPIEGHTHGHTIHLDLARLNIPDGAEFAGWRVLLSILSERARAKPKARTIGTRAAPTQYNLDGMLKVLRTGTPVRRFDERGARVTSLSDLGLGDDEAGE